jgi:uncharacterized protein (DUF885 family)
MLGMLAAVALLAADSTPSQRLAALGERVFLHQIADEGLTRLRYGLPADRLPDLSFEGNQKEVAFWRSVRTALGRIPDGGLDHEEVLSKAVLGWTADHTIEGARFFWFSSGVTPYASRMPSIHQMFAAVPVATAADRSRYLDLVRQYANLIRQTRVKLQGQVARKLVLPKQELALAIPFFKAYRTEVRKSPLRVADSRLASVPAAERDAFVRELERRIGSSVNPALDSLLAYLEGPYSAAAPDKVGLWQYPGGKEYYRYLVGLHTTTDVPPEEIFAIGERQVDSITKELDAVRKQVGFSGTLEEFRASLRTDKRFFVSTPEEVGQRLDGFAAQMETKLDSLFRRRPKAPYGTARLAPELEPNMTYGFYNPPQADRPKGLYFYNGSKLSERNLAMAEGLTYHELVPGHHFQIVLQQENTALPRFRRDLYFTAYNEGWGDYSSMLGADAGLYQDPYSRAGRLMMEMMLGTRLVLDVGMNHYQWPLEKARAYMREHTLETETQIATETLRYGVDIPGQALAYRMGSLSIRKMREDLRKKLGDKFDIRAFHDAVLTPGSLPLTILSRHLDQVLLATAPKA